MKTTLKVVRHNLDAKIFNSCYVVDRQGHLIANHRKVILFPDIDNRYFTAGTGHLVLTLTTLGGQQFKAVVGICADMDPRPDKGQYDYMLADICRDNQVDCLIFPTAWDHYPDKCEGMSPKEIAIDIYNFWLSRLTPMIHEKLQVEKVIHPRYSNEWLFIGADRVGQEMGVDFKGCSTVIVFNRQSQNSDYFHVEDMLDHLNDGIILVRSLLKR